MPSSESEIAAARLARIKGLIDSLEKACSDSDDQQALFHKLRAEIKAAGEAPKPRRTRRSK